MLESTEDQGYECRIYSPKDPKIFIAFIGLTTFEEVDEDELSAHISLKRTN